MTEQLAREEPEGEAIVHNNGDIIRVSHIYNSTVIVKSLVRDELINLENHPPEAGEPPYQGLKYFDEGDSDRFFGREQLTARLIGRLLKTRFLAVIGASGSGKSSLVMAGVTPALKSGKPLADGSLPPSGSVHWSYRILRPGSHPLDSLAVALSKADSSPEQITHLRDQLAADPKSLMLAVRTILDQETSPHLFLVVDQFEEIFTQVQSSEERTAFIDALVLASRSENHQPIHVLICLRSDFYAQVAQHDALREQVSQYQEHIGPMSRTELLTAILAPLKQGNWKIQEGLIPVILDDIGTEPGALPLLSHTLLQTWERRRGRTLTVSGYSESGGIKGSIRNTAEDVFDKQLTPWQRPLAKLIFLRLAEISEDFEDRRTHSRRATFSELVTSSTDEHAVQNVIDILADFRLVTPRTVEPGHRKIVEVAHESLIREWPRLQSWLDEDRTGRIMHQQLARSVESWITLNRDRDSLYGGKKLQETLEWMEKNNKVIELTGGQQLISTTEQEFLNASRINEDKKRAQQNMLAQAQSAFAGLSALLPLVITFIGMSSTLMMFFWKQIIGFVLVGMLRGWAHELFTTLALTLALTLNYLMSNYIPVISNLPETSVDLFWMRTIILAGMIYLAPLVFIRIPRLARLATDLRLQSGLFGAIMGGINAWLLSGSIMYYIYVADYPIQFFLFSKPTDSALLSQVNNMMLYMPPHVLNEPLIAFIGVLIFVLAISTEPTDKIWVVTSRFFREKLLPIISRTLQVRRINLPKD